MDNQKRSGLEWDLTKQPSDVNNENITNNVIQYLGAQIDVITNKPWGSSITYRELKNKVVLVFHRQKRRSNESEDIKAIKKKISMRKNRRITVS